MLTSVRQALGETWGFRSAESIRNVRRQAKILFATTRNAYKNSALYQEVGGEDAEHPFHRATRLSMTGWGCGASESQARRDGKANQAPGNRLRPTVGWFGASKQPAEQSHRHIQEHRD